MVLLCEARLLSVAGTVKLIAASTDLLRPASWYVLIMAIMCMHCYVLIARLRLRRETVALLQTGLQVQEAQGVVGGGFVYSPGGPS